VQAEDRQYWAVVSPASVARTTFLQILNNQFLSIPPTARSYPFLSSEHIDDPHLRTPDRAIKYVGFDAERGGLGGTSLQGAYLSARYESRREEEDWTLREYLEGNTELNPLETDDDKVDRRLFARVVADLRLDSLLDRAVSNLSNGQTRRARIAKTLLAKPALLLLDGPFMGLDPPTVALLSDLLGDMARANSPRLVLSLRTEDLIPPWITHLVYIDANMNLLAQGSTAAAVDAVCNTKDEINVTLQRWPADAAALAKMAQASKLPYSIFLSPKRIARPASGEPRSRDGFPKADSPAASGGAIVEMRGVKVSYGPTDSPSRQTVLGDWQQRAEDTPGLHWSVHRGQRWGIFGPNGSGKTTLLSLVTSDHPQAYSLPIKLFGKSRLPAPGEPGISIFELQKRMGHSSPEVHTFFPKHLTVRRVLESAWADAPMSKPRLSFDTDAIVNAALRWFAPELHPTGESAYEQVYQLWHRADLSTKKTAASTTMTSRKEAERLLDRQLFDTDDLDWADRVTFRDLSFGQQRLALFLRAIIASPDLVILDEAFSGMDEPVREKAMLYLSHGETLEWVTTVPHRVTQAHSTHLKPSIFAATGCVRFPGLTRDQALLNISHSPRDVPGCVRQWLCLPEPGESKPARWGTLPGPLELNPEGWEEIWGTTKTQTNRA